jgi:hypothetical protein
MRVSSTTRTSRRPASPGQSGPLTRNRPAFPLVRTHLEPPAGIEPATPSSGEDPRPRWQTAWYLPRSTRTPPSPRSSQRPRGRLVLPIFIPQGWPPAMSHLPWNHREPLCGPPYPQVTADRRGQSYGFSLGEDMRSLPGHAVRESERFPQRAHRTGSVPLPRLAPRFGGRHQSAEQYGSLAHRRTATSAAPRTAAPSTSTRDGGIPRSGHTQTKLRGPGGGRGRTR